MEVYFIRRGQSVYNIEHRINQDIKKKVGLTELGRRQAEAIGKKLHGKKFDVIFSSPFLRTMETAKIIALHIGAKIVKESLVKEWNVGFEGKKIAEYNGRAENDVLHFKLPGKESWTDVRKRVEKFVIKLKRKKYSRVLVVTHEHVFRTAFVVFGWARDEEVVKKKIGNCEYVVFDL